MGIIGTAVAGAALASGMIGFTIFIVVILIIIAVSCIKIVP